MISPPEQFLEIATVDDIHEIVDSCGGFYGSDPKENGMLDHIDDEIIDDKDNKVSTET